MKRNLDAKLLDLDNQPFGDGATLKSVAFMVLSAPLEGDDKISLETKMKQYTLLQAVHKGGTVELSAEDITLLKSRAPRCLSLIAMGRFCEMLEQDTPLKSVA